MTRPATFNQRTAEAFLEAISDGASMTAACETVGVPRRTIRSWLERRPDFAHSFDAASKLRIQSLADRIADLGASVRGGGIVGHGAAA